MHFIYFAFCVFVRTGIKIFTHADGSKAIAGVCVRVSVCLSVCLSVCVCLHVKTKTAETKIIKLATGIAHHESSPTKRSKVKVTESQSAKRRSSGRCGVS